MKGPVPGRRGATATSAWAAGVDDAVAVLRGWQREPPPVSAEPIPFTATAVRLDAIAAQPAVTPPAGHG